MKVSKSQIRNTSIAYWSKRNPKTCFMTFLLSISKQNDIPWLPKDIRKLLFEYMTKFIQFHHNKIGNMNPYDKINNVSNNNVNKIKFRRLNELVLVQPITYIIPANTIKCTHISATRMGRENMHVKMAFNIQESKIANNLMKLEEGVKNSLEELIGDCVEYRPFLKTFHNSITSQISSQKSTENVLFFAKHMKMDYQQYDLKQHYESNPYTNINYIHFDEKHYDYCHNTSLRLKPKIQSWKIVDVKDWVKFDFVMTIYAISKTKSVVKSNEEKRWSIRFRLEPKLPFWLEVD